MAWWIIMKCKSMAITLLHYQTCVLNSTWFKNTFWLTSITDFTLIRQLSCMYPHVQFKHARLTECLPTHVALERGFISMSEDVPLEWSYLNKGNATEPTCELLPGFGHTFVGRVVTWPHTPATWLTFRRLNSRKKVAVFVAEQTPPVWEALPTFFTHCCLSWD